MSRLLLPSGYCFEYEGAGNWRGSYDDEWPIVVHAPTGAETEAGRRFIDGSRCVVFACPDGKFRAVTEVSVREVADVRTE